MFSCYTSNKFVTYTEIKYTTATLRFNDVQTIDFCKQSGYKKSNQNVHKLKASTYYQSRYFLLKINN